MCTFSNNSWNLVVINFFMRRFFQTLKMLRRSTRNVKKSSNLELSNLTEIQKILKKQTESNSTDLTCSERVERRIQSKKKSPKNNTVSINKGKYRITDTSSSESDIENYLEPIEKIDLNSSFFNIDSYKAEVPSFNKIEKEIFSGVTVTRLSDSDTSEDEGFSKPTELLNVAKTSRDALIHDKDEEIKTSIKEGETIAKLNFNQLQAYEKKIEEAKKSIELYNTKQAQGNIEQKQINVNNIHGLLAAGEMNQTGNRSQPSIESPDLNINNTETYTDSEQDDWEEINEEHDKHVVPKKELEITVEMPSTFKRERGKNLLSAVKRRLNRMKKENQVLIHKVHLLCWIAHGNYVNSVLNDESMLALGLSLIPSEKCYPAGRIDLDYLEQILKWYKRTVTIIERVQSKSIPINELLTEQIDRKEAYSKTMLVLIFIIILRSLGIQCRLVLSLQVEPVRPPANDLHFLGNSSDFKQNIKKGERTNDSKVSLEENKDINIGMKNIEASQRLKLDKSDIERGLQDCLGAKNVVINVERIKLDKSSRTSNKKIYNVIDNEYINNKSDLNNKQQTCSKYAKEKKCEYKKDVMQNLKRSSTTGKLQRVARSNERKYNKFKERRGPEKSSIQKLERMKTKDFRKSKTLKGNETNGSEKIKTHELQEVVRSTRTKSKSTANNSEKTIRSKSVSVIPQDLGKETKNILKTRSKSTSSATKITKISVKKKISQLDGSVDCLEEFKDFEGSAIMNKMLRNTSFENFYSQMYCQVSKSVETRNSLKILQLDGTTDEPSTSNPNLKILKASSKPKDENWKAKSHRKSSRKQNYSEGSISDSDDCFRESPIKKFKVIDKGKVVELARLKSAEKKICSSKKSESVKDKRSVNLKKLSHVDGYKAVEYERKKNLKGVDVTKDIMQLIQGKINEQKQIDKSKMVRKRKSIKYEDGSDDSDYVPETIKKKYQSDSDDEFYPKLKVKQRIQFRKEVKKFRKLKKPKNINSRKVISSDSEYTEEEIENKPMEKLLAKSTKKKKGNDVWLEVFLESEEKWISVDVIFGQVHCNNELYSRATHPVSYVLSWNNDNNLKDVTRRYCQNYNTVTRKLRVDNQWWNESLKHFIGPNNARDREEDDELNRQQLEKPLPTTISEYKNHPLYALERHLLKFEALYPPNAPPLGFVKNEPVYSRDCVHICHSRYIWLKQAKVVKLGEKPYKIVKARPKYDKLSNTMITDQNLEVFGPWQVEDYDPPTAENGVVPRNAFGNVDLFKPSMLPKKCVHLQLPGLNKIARRMHIDIASAIVGFDMHGGWIHPVYDGFVVCEEYEDQLVAAWNLEQEEIEHKEQEKYEKRVYGNWKKLIRGLSIKQRLKAKYGFGEMKQEITTHSGSASNKQKSSCPNSLAKKRRVISDSSESENDDIK